MAKERKAIERKQVELPANPAQTFRQKIQALLRDNEEMLVTSMQKLPPKEFCDVYIRLLPYGFAKVPEERPIDPTPDNTKAILEERERKITLISGNRMEDVEIIED